MKLFFLKKNNAKSTLAVAVSNLDTTLTVADASKFPTTGNFIITIWDKNTYPDPGDDSNMEILKVTGVSGDTFTIVRAQENTTGEAHGLGHAVEVLITKGQIEELETEINNKRDDFTLGNGLSMVSGNVLIVNESQISHVNISGKGVNSHSVIDSHLVNISNPHSVTKSQVGLGNVQNTLHKFDAMSAPTVDEDSGDGYSTGSIWIDITSDESYLCLDATVGSAIWRKITKELTDKIKVCYTFTDEGINACIDALGSSGGMVILPPGTYVIDGTITIDYNNTTLMGAGWSTILDASGWSTGHIINLNGKDYCQIKDLQIIGKAGGGNNTDLIIDGGTSTNGLFENLYLKDADRYGIYIADSLSYYNRISKCYVDNCDNVGIIVLAARYSVIEANQCFNNGQHGFYIDGRNNTIESNIAGFNTQDGFFIVGGECFVNDNISLGNTLNGFEIAGSRNAISNNLSDTNGRSGFYITSDKNQISDNWTYKNGNNYYGFYLVNADDNNVIGNYAEGFVDREEYGFYLQNSTYNNLNNNKVLSHDTGGIFIDSNSSNNHVVWNHLERETTPIINNGGVTNTVINAVAGAITTTAGRKEKTTRVTSSPYVVLATDNIIFVDTDGGAITVNLPVGVEGTRYKIINLGSSGNDVTVDPNGTEQIYGGGAGVAITLVDGENIDIHYNSTEGWW